jgi:hypothetical protein
VSCPRCTKSHTGDLCEPCRAELDRLSKGPGPLLRLATEQQLLEELARRGYMAFRAASLADIRRAYQSLAQHLSREPGDLSAGPHHFSHRERPPLFPAPPPEPPGPLTCALCGAQVQDPETASEAGWLAYFFLANGKEAPGPACQACHRRLEYHHATDTWQVPPYPREPEAQPPDPLNR